MATFGNLTLLYTIFGCSLCTAVGLSLLLVRVSLRDQTRALLQDRLKVIKVTRKFGLEPPKIFLRKEQDDNFEKENKLAGYLCGNLGLRVNPKWALVVLLFLVIIIFSLSASYVFTNSYLGPILGITIFFISIGIFWILKFRRAKFLTSCENQLPEALDFIVRALRAGHAFPTSISLLGEELPPPLGPEFRRIFKEQELGIPLSYSLSRLTQKMPVADLKYFVTAYKVNRELGGNLAEVLESMSKIIRERFKLKRHIQALTSEGRLSAWILGILPFAVVVVMYIVRPENVNLLLTEPIGQKLVFTGICLWLVGVGVLKRIVRFDY